MRLLGHRVSLRLHRIAFTFRAVQSHLAIPERAEPDTALNRTKSVAAPDYHTIHPAEPETGKFRIRMISGSIPPWSS